MRLKYDLEFMETRSMRLQWAHVRESAHFENVFLPSLAYCSNRALMFSMANVCVLDNAINGARTGDD